MTSPITKSVCFLPGQVGEVGIMDLLIEKGADVHVRDADGSTPLILAAFHGQVAAVQRLLSAGSDIHASDNDGYTALMWASYKGRNEAANILLQSGADSNATSREGNTTLVFPLFYKFFFSRVCERMRLFVGGSVRYTHTHLTHP